MIKTFNRSPIGVDTSTKDTQQQFFNQYQWKGLSDNKNFLAVDQETFSDCNNVYVDEEGLLKSRPSLKIKTAKYSIKDVKYVLSDIVDMWSFDYVTVYKSKIGDDYYLTFINKNHTDAAQMPLSTANIKLVLAQEKIFIFSEVSFDYYDIVYNKCWHAEDAEKFIHIPVTKVISNGIELSAENVESPNILTSSHIIKYLYTSIDKASFDMFIGKELTVEIDGNIYEIKKFVPNNQLVFVNKYCNLSINQFADEYLLGPEAKGTPLVDVSSKGNMIISSYEYTFDGKYSNVTYTIYHTLDGMIFYNLPTISNALGMPKISQCGNYCFVFKEDGPYVYTLSTTEGVTQYQGWANLLKKINKEEYEALSLNLNNGRNEINVSNFNQSTNINGYFIDNTHFAFTYCDDMNTSTKRYTKMFLIYVKGDQITHKKLTAVFDSLDVFEVYQYMPNLHFNERFVVVDFVYYRSYGASFTSNRSHIIFSIDNSQLYKLGALPMVDFMHSICINSVNDVQNNITLAFMYYYTIHVYTYTYNENGTFEQTYKSLSYTYTDRRYPKTVILDKSTRRLITNCEFYNYDDYTSDGDYTAIPLLFACMPICSIDNKMFVATTDAIFTSTTESEFIINELHKGKVNYLLPNNVTMLSNYYFSQDNKLYISAPSVDLSVVRNEIIKKPLDFKWYFPEISKQIFDYPITNLHPISNSEVGIFFENSVSYVTFDSDVNAYRYIKSKLQTGCKYGSDVITSFDGKYIVFVSPRGFVAMTYQEFMATTEQTLNYLSDTIYTTFNNFITEENSSNAIKLYKYAYWFFLYKQDRNKMLLFDIRNNTWWPIEVQDNIVKCIDNNNAPLFLIKNKLFTLDKSNTDYYDYDNVKPNKIKWYIQSQKLHLNALNYYKHIVNMTFVSSYNDTNISPAYELQINNYRKQINGNINEEDSYTSITYNVNMVRTFIQRLNYFKVNEFQYKLSSDKDDATDYPLSLTNITIKYKISTQVR